MNIKKNLLLTAISASFIAQGFAAGKDVVPDVEPYSSSPSSEVEVVITPDVVPVSSARRVSKITCCV
jgi:hypothetical protein